MSKSSFIEKSALESLIASTCVENTKRGIYSSNTYPSREQESRVFRATGEVEDPGRYIRVDGVDGKETDNGRWRGGFSWLFVF